MNAIWSVRCLFTLPLFALYQNSSTTSP